MQAIPMLMQVGGQVMAGNAAKAAGDANAAMMRQEAGMAREQGGARQETQLRRARELLGKQRAAIGQAGIGWGGSADDILDQSETNAMLDTMNIGYEAELQARGLMNRASLTEREGKQARQAAYLKAGTSLLTGAANYAGTGFSGTQPPAPVETRTVRRG